MNLFRIHIIVLIIFISAFAEDVVIETDGYGRYSGQISKSFNVIGSKSLLEMTKIRGDIFVSSNKGKKQIIVKEIFDVKAYSKSKAENLINKSKASYIFQNNELAIKGNDDNDDYHSYFEITVPIKIYLDITNSMGDISIQDISGKMSLKTTHGDIDMEKVNGNISVHTINGSFCGENMKADINCHSVNDDIDLFNISGNLSLQSSNGDITIDQITGSGKISSSTGCIEIDNLTGEHFSAETSSGDIEVGKIDTKLTLKASGGCIYMKHSKNDVNLFTSGGDIVVKKNDGNLNADVNGGDITIGHVSGNCKVSTRSGCIIIYESIQSIEAISSNGFIEIKKTMGKVLAHTTHGNIELVKEINNIDDSIDLKTKHGDIIVQLPKDINADVLAKIYAPSSSINDYEIISDFNLDNYKMINKGSKSYIYKKGQINEGGSPVLLQTVDGQIKIIQAE